MLRFFKRFILFIFLLLSLYLFFNEIYSYHEPIDTMLHIDNVIKSSTTILGSDWEMLLYYVNGEYEIDNEVYTTRFISPYEYHVGNIKRILVDNNDYSNILCFEEMVVYSVMLFISFFLFLASGRKDKKINSVNI